MPTSNGRGNAKTMSLTFNYYINRRGNRSILIIQCAKTAPLAAQLRGRHYYCYISNIFRHLITSRWRANPSGAPNGGDHMSWRVTYWNMTYWVYLRDCTLINEKKIIARDGQASLYISADDSPMINQDWEEMPINIAPKSNNYDPMSRPATNQRRTSAY